MNKKKTNVAKEIFILLLLLILIILILAVTLYDFIPSNVNVSEAAAISYSSDSATTSIKQEIAYTNGGDVTGNQSQLVTSLKSYSIDAADLAVYGERNYNKGNSNPFDYGAEETPPAPTTPETNTSTTTTQQTPANQTTSTSTPGTFFEKPNSK